MPVVDETIHTLEIKKFKKEVNEKFEEVLKRLEALEKPKSGK